MKVDLKLGAQSLMHKLKQLSIGISLPVVSRFPPAAHASPGLLGGGCHQTVLPSTTPVREILIRLWVQKKVLTYTSVILAATSMCFL